MGFEITYSIKNDNEDIEDKKIKVGKPTDETSIEELAGRIMSLYANRSLDIVDVKIEEYTKKTLSFKQVNDGILIKNRKFKYGYGPALTSTSVYEEEQAPEVFYSQNNNFLKIEKSNDVPIAPAIPPKNISKDILSNEKGRLPHEVLRKAIKHEVFNPDTELESEAKTMNFIKGKKYPIFEEKNLNNKIFYLVEDENGKTLQVFHDFFTPEVKLTNQSNITKPPEKINLSYGKPSHSDQIVLRGK